MNAFYYFVFLALSAAQPYSQWDVLQTSSVITSGNYVTAWIFPCVGGGSFAFTPFSEYPYYDPTGIHGHPTIFMNNVKK